MNLAPGPVTVGFVGAGNVLPAYLQTLDRLVPLGAAAEGPVCARSPDARAALLARRPGTRVVATAAEVVEDPGTDLVVVLTPPSSHAELVRAALAAGKHVLCEKPLAWTAAEAAALFAAAGEAGRLLIAAPFVHLSPLMRRMWTLVADGELGHVHSARAHYGNPGSTWAPWYHREPLATLGDIAVYNLTSLAALLGPVGEVQAASATATRRRVVRGRPLDEVAPDTWQLVLRHEGGALSSVLASSATAGYRRPGLELYGTGGTAVMLGDDWDPHGLEVWREAAGSWELVEPPDTTWLWTDGLREAVAALRGGGPALASPELAVHVVEVVEAAGRAAASGGTERVVSRFPPFEALRWQPGSGHHAHDRTRPLDEQ